ncbi:MAG: hypothetical protein HY328_15680, partial [Chloroflexi bacterium]|nr:hypothetical protein [Chloroflexota bacterium]
MTRQIWTVLLLSLLLVTACAGPAAAEPQAKEEGDHLPELVALKLAAGEKLR